MTVTQWSDPGSLGGLGVAVLAAVAVAAVALAGGRRRWLAAVVVGSVAFQLVHFGEHVAQAGYWAGHRGSPPYLTPWAAAARSGLTYWCAVWGGKGAGPARGNELLHLVGNAVFFAGALAAVVLVRRGASSHARRAVRWWVLFEGLHLVEHVALTATLFGFGTARGLSTGFGLIAPTSSGAVAYRLWWHFAVNLVALLLAVSAAHRLLWRPAYDLRARRQPMTTALRVLEPQCEWTADDVADEETWTEQLSVAELDELDGALRHALKKSSDVLELGRDDFPLTTLRHRLQRIEDELINGRGFVRLRGVDRSAYTQAEMELIYWGIGTHLGLPWPQNKHGHVLGDVTDQQKALNDPTARGNELGGVALPYHCDGSDLVGLMCLENGIAGGLSAVSNSVRIHNQLVAERSDLAAALYDPVPYDFRGEQAPGGAAYYMLPVFTEWEDRLFVRCIPPYIWASQRHADAPRLTEVQTEALHEVVRMADDPSNFVHMELLPGDMQFINNYHVLHGRTAYEDDRTGGRVRHLKRLWLETTVLDSRPPYFENRHSHWAENRSASRMQVN